MSALQIIGIIVPIIISIVAIVFSCIASAKANKANIEANRISSQNVALVAENTRLSNGNMEIQVREMISEARRFFFFFIQNKLMSRINSDIAKNPSLVELVDNLLRDAQQDYLNAYEEACMKYIDGKIDKTRFRKTYFEEIRNIVRDKNFKEQFDFSSTYYAIKQVYDEWSNPERS